MKLIVAVVKPFLAERVLEGLKRARSELAPCGSEGYGRQKNYLRKEYGENEFSLCLSAQGADRTVGGRRPRERDRSQDRRAARTGRMGTARSVMPTAKGRKVIDL